MNHARPKRQRELATVSIRPQESREIEVDARIGSAVPPPETAREVAAAPIVDKSGADEPGADEPGADEPGADEPGVGARIGQYELIRLLGRGGMGSVHLARDLRLGRRVAIKFLIDAGPRRNQRFTVEARATARCQHPNIVVIHDVGEHRSRPYMVLEYLQGQTLEGWLDEHAPRLPDERTGTLSQRVPLTGLQAVERMVPVVRSLVYAHERGIVHRDLKPANIMLTTDGQTKVLDFGVAQLRADVVQPDHPSDEMSLGGLVGTVAYMSPEQLEGAVVDARSDLWAVGVMLYQMVLGRHPLTSLTSTSLFALTDLDEPMPRVSESAPQMGPLAGLIDRCLLKNREHRIGSAGELLSELESLLPDRGGGSHRREDDKSPFAGLAAFQERDSHRFFGRTGEIAELITRLTSQPLIAIAGPSGLGKSSLVRAGVIPALKRSAGGWSAHTVRPGRQPLAALRELLHGLTDSTAGDSRESVSPGPDADAPLSQEPGYLGARLRAWARRRHRRLLLFIDQFEELFTLGNEAAEIREFLACIEGVADDASSPLRVVISMRSDFLFRLAEHRAFMASVGAGLFLLPPLTRDGLRDALVRPVEDAGYRFENPSIVADLVDQVAESPGTLPLMQFAASRLWRERDRSRHVLTEERYHAMGGLAGTLAAHADTVIAGMSAEQRRLVRKLLERLVTPERTRAVVNLSELRALATSDQSGSIDQLVRYLVDVRLLTVAGAHGAPVALGELDAQGDARGENQHDPDGGDPQVEFIHESLIECWPRLAGWLDENREDAAFLSRVREAARAWQRSGHADGLLWRGEPARQAVRWRAHYRGDLAPREARFLDSVTDLAAQMRKRRRALVVGSIAVLSILVVITTLALLTARRELRTVRAQEATLQQQSTRLQEHQTELRQQRDNLRDNERTLRSKQAELTRSLRAKEAAHKATEAALARADQRTEEARLSAKRARKAKNQAIEQRRLARAAQRAAERAAEHERRIREELDYLRRQAVGELDAILD